MWMIALGLFALQGTPADSQVAMVATAVRFVVEDVGIAEYTLDTDRAQSGRAAMTKDVRDIPMDTVARQLGVATTRSRDAVVCSGPRPDNVKPCTLIGANALVRIGGIVPMEDGATITVYVMTQWRKERLFLQMRKLLMRATPQGWVVEREIARGAS